MFRMYDHFIRFMLPEINKWVRRTFGTMAAMMEERPSTVSETNLFYDQRLYAL